MCVSCWNNMLIECRFGITSIKEWKPSWTYMFGYNPFWEYFGSCRQSETPVNSKCVYTFFESAWVVNFKEEETHVSAHMFFVKSLIFIHGPCYYLVFCPVLSLCCILSCPVCSLAIYFLFTDLCSAYELFEARFIFVDNADISFVCKSFESSRSAANLYQTVCL